FLQLLPYLCGRQLQKRWPQWATRIDRGLKVVITCCLAATLVLLVLVHPFRSLPLLDRSWWAVLAFALVGMALGWALGGPHPQVRRSFVVTASARDGALALVLASLAFSDRDVQLATIAVWLALSLLDLAFALLVSRSRGRTPLWSSA